MDSLYRKKPRSDVESPIVKWGKGEKEKPRKGEKV
jgi:hypothetical protein